MKKLYFKQHDTIQTFLSYSQVVNTHNLYTTNNFRGSDFAVIVQNVKTITGFQFYLLNQHKSLS